MHPRMSDAELALFRCFLRPAETYVEFGTGGSTVLAAQQVRRWAISVDSSVEWLEKVRMACEVASPRIVPTLLPVDIGPLGDWGALTDKTTRDRWPAYHEDVWGTPGSTEAGLYMVDGRFRVACFMQVLLHCRPGAVVLIHDFAERPQYQVVHEVTREVARAEQLSAFVVEPGLDRAQGPRNPGGASVRNGLTAPAAAARRREVPQPLRDDLGHRFQRSPPRKGSARRCARSARRAARGAARSPHPAPPRPRAPGSASSRNPRPPC